MSSDTPTPLTDEFRKRSAHIRVRMGAGLFCLDLLRSHESLERTNAALRGAIERAPHGESLVTAYKCGAVIGMACDCWKSAALSRAKV